RRGLQGWSARAVSASGSLTSIDSDVRYCVRMPERVSASPQDRFEVPALVPARMLNEHAYCPRLAYLEWVQGDFADSVDTVDGRHQHRRVDKETGTLPSPEDIEGERIHARSVMLSAPAVGLIARIDLIESDGMALTPVDYKRG